MLLVVGELCKWRSIYLARCVIGVVGSDIVGVVLVMLLVRVVDLLLSGWTRQVSMSIVLKYVCSESCRPDGR